MAPPTALNPLNPSVSQPPPVPGPSTQSGPPPARRAAVRPKPTDQRRGQPRVAGQPRTGTGRRPIGPPGGQPSGQHPLPPAPRAPASPPDLPDEIEQDADPGPIANRLNPDAEQPGGPQADDQPGEQDENSSQTRRRPGARKARAVERREDIEPASMTAEMEPISEVIQEKRRVDATLARFSAVHDEMAAEEQERKSRRKKLMPWLNTDDPLDAALSAQSPTTALKKPEPTRMVGPVGEIEHEADDADGFDDDFEPDGEPAVAADEPERGGPLTRLQAKKRKHANRTALICKIAAAAVAVLVLTLTGIEYGTKTTANDAIQQVVALDENSPAIQNAPKQSGDENFLLLGSSARAGAATNSLLTDTIMVAHVPADRSRVVVVSFPGTLEVTRPECKGWNNQSSRYTGEQIPAQDGVRLDTVYQSGGPRCVTDTVQALSGLRINHFVGIDFGGFTDVVDALQGVTICSKAPVRDSRLGTIIPTGGTQTTLSGQQALNYARADHVIGDTSGVYGRIIRQQRLMAALLRKLVAQNMLSDVGKLNGLLTTFGKSTYGDNMGVDQLTSLATSLQGINLNRVTFVTVPTTGATDAAGNQTLAQDKAAQLFNAVIGNSPLTGEPGAGQNNQPADNTGGPPVDPKTVKIQVLNGGDTTTDAAKTTSTKLRDQGFQVVNVHETSTVASTIIKYAPNEEAAARTLASSVPIATLVRDPEMDSEIDLILGPNFDGKVVAPHAIGTGQGTPSGGVPDGLSIVNAADTSCA